MKFAALPALFMTAVPCLAETAPGVDTLRDDSVTGRSLSMSVWYPSDEAPSDTIGGNAVFEGMPVATEAALPAGSLPLVVVSHGGLRSAADSGAWLSAGLAEAGYVVVEVNAPRPGSAEAALQEIWQRPADIGRALDTLLADGKWGPRIDTDRVAVVGVALGGTAALSLAGASLDSAMYTSACAGGGSEWAPDCGWFAGQGVDLADTDVTQLSRMDRDPRIDDVVAVNPEYTGALGPVSTEVDSLTITLGGAPDATTTDRSLPLSDATPFDVFALCTEAGPDILREDGGDDALCGTSGAAREAVHRDIVEAIAAFLAEG